jgi:mannitol-1-phosphate 5-dehydrogenase
MVKALIFGAGAIGRGFIPLCLPKNAKITFVDESLELVNSLKRNGKYSIFQSYGGKLIKNLIETYEVFHLNELSDIDYSVFDVVFIAVGPRNIEKLPINLSAIINPIFCLENDPATVDRLKKILKIDNVFFGVPDVITSSSASPKNLANDILSIHTEKGTLYLSKPHKIKSNLTNEIKAVWTNDQRLELEWDAKLYLHNAPHCIAAYLGKLHGCSYIHEALQVKSIEMVVKGVISEILTALSASNKYEYEFLTSYARKELYRFKDVNLFDPIDRVARQPLRKLRYEKHGRLLGALQMCLINEVYPNNLLIGISAALSYPNTNDDDAKSLALIDYYGIENFIWHYLSIEPNTLMSELISHAYKKFKNKKG